MKKLYYLLFKLPPVEDRHIAGGIFKELIYPDWKAYKDDNYIYYLSLKFSFIITLAITTICLLLYWTGLNINFFSYRIYIPSNYGFKELYKLISTCTAKPLLYIFLPYFIILYRININPAQHDVLWASRRYIKPENRRMVLQLIHYILVEIILLYGLFNMQAPFMLLKKYAGLGESNFYIALWSPVFILAEAAFFMCSVFGIVVIWHTIFNISGYKEEK